MIAEFPQQFQCPRSQLHAQTEADRNTVVIWITGTAQE